MNSVLPEEWRREWASELAAPIDERQECDGLFVSVFRIGEALFGLDTALIREVTPRSAVNPIPGAKPLVLGIAAVRGRILTCVDLAGLLRMRNGDASRLLIVQAQDWSYCSPVDEVLGSLFVESAQLGPLPSTLASHADHLSSSIFDYQGKTAALLDREALLQTIEKEIG